MKPKLNLPTKCNRSEMHRAKNFQPEWGYVAGANSFKRTIQIVFVATAIGATAGGGVVLSLVDFPTGQASVAAHTTAAPAKRPSARLRSRIQKRSSRVRYLCRSAATRKLPQAN